MNKPQVMINKKETPTNTEQNWKFGLEETNFLSGWQQCEYGVYRKLLTRVVLTQVPHMTASTYGLVSRLCFHERKGELARDTIQSTHLAELGPKTG